MRTVPVINEQCCITPAKAGNQLHKGGLFRRLMTGTHPYLSRYTQFLKALGSENDMIVEGLHRQYCLQYPGSTQCVTIVALQTVHWHIAEPCFRDGHRLHLIHKHRRRTMGINHRQIVGIHVSECDFQGPCGPFSRSRRGTDVVAVITDGTCTDGPGIRLSHGILGEDYRGSSLAEVHACTLHIEGSTGGRRDCLQRFEA